MKRISISILLFVIVLVVANTGMASAQNISIYYSQQIDEHKLGLGSTPVLNWNRLLPYKQASVGMQDGVSGSFSGDNPIGGSITYAITGVVADGAPTEEIRWVQASDGSHSGLASRSYTGYIVGDSVTLSYGLTGEKFCKSLSFAAGNESVNIGCYGWDSKAPSGSITLDLPKDSGSVAFRLSLWATNPYGRADVIVSGNFTRQKPPENVPAAPPPADPPAPPPADPPSSSDVVLPPVPTPRQTDSDGLWEVILGGMAIIGVLGILGVLGVGGLGILIAIYRGWLKPRPGPNQVETVNAHENEISIGVPTDTMDWGKYEPGFEKEWIKSQVSAEIDKLKEEGYFIGNASEFRKVWNLTVGQVTNRIRGWKNSMYCEEMVTWGNDHLSRILPEGSYVTQIKLERNRFYNHIANKVILPDGTELVVDYWQSLADGKPAIYTVEEWLSKWEKALGKPKWGDWNIHGEIDGAQASLIEHVLRRGEESIDNWRFKGKTEGYDEFNTVREWWRTLDSETKVRLKRDYHNRFPQGEMETFTSQMRHGRIIRQSLGKN